MKYIIEESTHPHVLYCDDITFEKVTIPGVTVITVLTLKGLGYILHDEHKTIVLEHEHILVYVQQEFNPVTKAYQAQFD